MLVNKNGRLFDGFWGLAVGEDIGKMDTTFSVREDAVRSKHYVVGNMSRNL